MSTLRMPALWRGRSKEFRVGLVLFCVFVAWAP